MSADNYYVIRKHPKGGYALAMGFMSDENDSAYITPINEDAKQYPTVASAEEAFEAGQEYRPGIDYMYPEFYCEYGLFIGHEIETTPVDDVESNAFVPSRQEMTTSLEQAFHSPSVESTVVTFSDQRFCVMISDDNRKTTTMIVVEGNPEGGYMVRNYAEEFGDKALPSVVMHLERYF